MQLIIIRRPIFVSLSNQELYDLFDIFDGTCSKIILFRDSFMPVQLGNRLVSLTLPAPIFYLFLYSKVLYSL